jgi:hypothetical protein
MNNGGAYTGAIWNEAGALWDIQCDQALQDWSSYEQFQNAGRVLKSANGGTTGFSLYLDNSGTVEPQSGTIWFENGGSLGGSLVADAGAAINLAGGIYTVVAATFQADPSGAIYFGGTPPITGGTVSLGTQPTTLTFDGLVPALTVSEGTLALNANAFTIDTPNGQPLPPGTYVLLQTPGAITENNVTFAGYPYYPAVGSALGWPGTTPSVSVSGNNVILSIGYTCSYTDTGKSYSQLDQYDVQLNFSNTVGGLDTVVGYNMINCSFGSAIATAYGVAIPVSVPVNTLNSNDVSVTPTTLPLGTTNLVLIATAIDQSGDSPIPGGGTARVNAAVSDSCGNLISFDPIIQTLYLSQSGEVKITFNRLSENDKYVSLKNGSPGLSYARIIVNGRSFPNIVLTDGANQVLDITSALSTGAGNTVVVEGFGATGAGAVVGIGEIPAVPTSGSIQVTGTASGVSTFINLPALQLSQSGSQTVLSWPTTGPKGEDFTRYELQTKTSLASATWNPVLTPPAVSAGQISVTVPVVGAGQFYRLANPVAP